MDVASPCPSLLGSGVKAGVRNSDTVQIPFSALFRFCKDIKVVTLNQFHLQLALNCSLHKHGENLDPGCFCFAILFPIVFIPIRIRFTLYRSSLEQFSFNYVFSMCRRVAYHFTKEREPPLQIQGPQPQPTQNTFARFPLRLPILCYT